MPLPPSEELSPFLAEIQKRCLPGIWSKGVALSREGSVQLDQARPEEIILRVLVKDRPVSPKVTLWPEDEDAYCDCGDRNEICAHIAASAIALKAGSIKASTLPGASAASASPGARPASLAPRLSYRLLRKEGALALERFVVYADREVPLTETLVSYVGGISSGRISAPPVPATREDFAVDSALGQPRRGVLDRAILRALLSALSRVPGLSLDGEPIEAASKPTGMLARVGDAPGGGFRLQGEMDPSITEVFSNGAALCGNQLRPIEIPALTQAESAVLTREGKLFRSPSEIVHLVSELLPALERKLPVELATTRLPRPRQASPRIRLALEPAGGERLRVIPRLAYDEKPTPGEILVPEPAAERMLARKLQNELHLNPGQPVELDGLAAVDFVRKLQARPGEWALEGEGLARFGLATRLKPRLEAADSGSFALFFEEEGGGGAVGAGSRSADPARVLRAWRQGEAYVPLLGGGWAPLPLDWLSRYGSRIAALLAAREHSGPQAPLPAHLLPELASLAEDLEAPLPPRLRALRDQLERHQGIPAASLPSDLRASLRHYQRQGVDWLCLLRDSGMGAMLADDMGLGKTLQSLCAIRGRTLIVTPTSVLSGWASQIAAFRPGLRASTYYGPARKLDPSADVTLTTYALLRLDREKLAAEKWDTIVLDEAQTIRNPESQVARAAHSLQAAFRVALSGTPVENRLEDLWSQFQFLNPGLLGSRESFEERFTAAASRGDREALAGLRARIRPFLLRRLKKEVAPELPPRTETVLHCELSEPEQELYDSILAASRKEVLERLEGGGNVFAALEMLLRLRQACCHPALVPGGAEATRAAEGGAPSSSKLDLLLETLDESIGLGHRALVFSQWTSLLDLIEPRLRAAGHGFTRLDGATRDREAVVNEFQKEDGPPVMLISLKAGGVGLTLTAADHIFILDPWWNPAAEDQAADRAHRIGQRNPVLIHRLVAKDTIEDRILALQKRKQELAGAVLEDSSAAVSLTREDILELLA